MKLIFNVLRSSIFITPFLFLSCKDGNLENKEIEILASTDTLRFKIPELKSKFFQLYETDTSELLIYYSEIKNRLEFYNDNKIIDSLDLSFCVTPYKPLGGYHYLNKDSIFLKYWIKSDFAIVNNQKEIINSIHVKEDTFQNEKCDFRFISDKFMPLTFFNNKLFVWKIKDLSMGDYSKETYKNFFNSNTNVTLSFKSDSTYEIRNKMGMYPSLYKTGLNYGGTSFMPSRTINEKENLMVFVYSLVDSIYVYDMDTEKLLSTHFIDGNYWKDPNEFDSDSIFNNSYGNKFATNEYANVLLSYDKYRDLYYVISKHASDFNDEKGNLILATDCPWSLIMLDKNFNKVGEKVFPGKDVNSDNLIITKEGLLFSLHTLNSNYRPNESTFVLYKIGK